MGEDRIALSVDPDSSPRTGQRVTVNLDYAGAGENGVVPPIVITATPALGDGRGAQRRVFARRPSSFSFRADVPGQWLIVAAESAHNRYQGRLVVTVAGAEHDYVSVTPRTDGRASVGISALYDDLDGELLYDDSDGPLLEDA